MSSVDAIWHHSVQAGAIEGVCKGGMPGNLEIRIDELGPDFMRGSMPVNEKTHQPYGLLHGGASCVLAETLGSIAAALVVDQERWIVLGQEINANHLRGVRDGRVHGVATPEHIGSRSQVWSIRIHDDQQRPVCVSRLTVAVVEKR
ncbi:MAG: hotdog fold thioesterase, partial [Pseudomonadota bacterium]